MHVMDQHPTTATTGTPIAGHAFLERWAAHDWRDGLRVDDLLPLDRVIVRTLNSVYELVVKMPGTAEVMVRGGAFFPTFAVARLAGASLGGSFLKLHSIHVGFRVELITPSRVIVTSAVRSISLARPGRVM
jgi:hypothetical protein